MPNKHQLNTKLIHAGEPQKKYGFEQVGTQETDGGKKEVSLMVYKIIL